MKPLKIIWSKIRISLHHFGTFHNPNIIWYNGPGYERAHAIWKIECSNCPKRYYLDPKIDAIIDREIQAEKMKEMKIEKLREETAKSRMN